MKKIILLTFSLLLTFLLCGCNEKTSTDDDEQQYGKLGVVIKHGDEISDADESWLPSISDTKNENDFELKVNETYVMKMCPLLPCSNGYLERLINLTYDESVFEITPAYDDEYWHIRDATYCITVKKEVKMATIVAESDVYKSRTVILITAKE